MHFQKSVATAWFGATLAFGAATSSAQANDGFFVEQLPAGKSVTLPRPAITFVPVSGRVTLTATDLPQTVKLTPVNLSAGGAPNIRVAIFDRHQERVRYIDLRAGSPALYNFHALGSIAMVPQTAGGVASNIRIRIESDKPLEISR
jgi:hypothetical protein